MAAQQKLGLWTKRRSGSHSGDNPDSSLVGEDLDEDLHCSTTAGNSLECGGLPPLWSLGVCEADGEPI